MATTYGMIPPRTGAKAMPAKTGGPMKRGLPPPKAKKGLPFKKGG